MTAPDALNDHVKLTSLNQALEQARTEQEALLEAWESTSLELEAFES